MQQPKLHSDTDKAAFQLYHQQAAYQVCSNNLPVLRVNLDNASC